MSSMDHPTFYVGRQESFVKKITQCEISLFAGLIGNNFPHAIEKPGDLQKFAYEDYVSQFLMTGIISGVLQKNFTSQHSQFVNTHFEFLAPIVVDEQITVVIEIIGFEPQKRLTTFKADCYDEKKNQILTGQVIILVSD